MCNSNTLSSPQDETCCLASVCSTITEALKKFDILFWAMFIPAKSLFFRWKSSKVINLAELFVTICLKAPEAFKVLAVFSHEDEAKYRKQSSKSVILLKCSKNSN